MPGQLTLTAKLDQLTGDSDVLAALRITLCNFGTIIPAIVGTSTIARGQYLVKQQTTAPISVKLWGNDLINPNTTFYCIEVLDSKGTVIQAGNYRLSGAGPLDLSDLLPFLSPAPPPILPPLIVNQLQVLSGLPDYDFNGATYLSFKAVLNQNATFNIAYPQPGNLYTIIIVQDATGGHTVTFGGNILNETDVNLAPNSTTIQTFVCDDNYNFWAIGPGTWWKP